MKLGLILFFSIPFLLFSQYKLLSTEGQYQGDKLFIKNPKQVDGFGYCIIKVTVNGDVLPASIQTSNFAINFDLFDLKIGDDVFVVIEHFEGCKPRFLNPESLLPKSSFEIVDIYIDEDAVLKWTAKNEKNILDYEIEKFKWGEWKSVGQVRGRGGAQKHSYSYKIPIHSGKNKVRLSQLDNTGEKKASEAVEFVSRMTPYTFGPSSVRDYIYFYHEGKKAKTKFEVYDAFGNLLKIGTGTSVDCRNIVNGIYYINYDSKSEKFIKVN